MKLSRGYAVTAAATGAGVVLFAASRVWIDHDQSGFGLPPDGQVGRDLLPWLPALALAALAGAAALLATKGVLRAVVSSVLVLSGFGMAGAGLFAVIEGAPVWSPIAALVGGVLVVHAGLLAFLRGHAWPEWGARYQRAAVPDGRPRTSAAMWEALDRGEDPTT